MEKRYFQYIAGENVGEIKTLKDVILEDGITYLEFTDGDLMNRDFVSPMTNRRSDLKNKVMVEISDINNGWSVEDIKARTVKLGDDNYAKNVPPIEDYMRMNGSGQETTVDSFIGGKRLVPPKHKVSPRPLPRAKNENMSDEELSQEEIDIAYGKGDITEYSDDSTPKKKQQAIETTSEIETVEVEGVKDDIYIVEKPIRKVEEQPKPKKSSLSSSDPVAILVGSSKKLEYDLDVKLSIKLPQKSLYNIVAEQFDDGKEKFIQYILDGLDTSDIIKSIGEALKVSYES